MLRIAVVQPFLAHHDAVALAGGVDDNGGIIAGCIISFGGVGREIGIILAVLEQNVFIQRAALVILRQALNDGVPVGVVFRLVFIVEGVDNVLLLRNFDGYIIMRRAAGFLNVDLFICTIGERQFQIRGGKVKFLTRDRLIDTEADSFRR